MSNNNLDSLKNKVEQDIANCKPSVKEILQDLVDNIQLGATQLETFHQQQIGVAQRNIEDSVRDVQLVDQQIRRMAAENLKSLLTLKVDLTSVSTSLQNPS